MIDITEAANNSVQSTKKQRGPFGAKLKKCILLIGVNSFLYNFYFSSQITIPKHCFEQLTKRLLFSFQNLLQDDNIEEKLLAAFPFAQSHRFLKLYIHNCQKKNLKNLGFFIIY